MNKKFNDVVVEINGVRTIAGGGTGASTAEAALSAIAALGISSSSYIIAKPGDDLAAKYAAAKLLTPNGSVLSATNRASLVIMPGSYSLAAQLVIDAEFVDVIGLGAQTQKPAVFVTGSTWAFANNIKISGILVDGWLGSSNNLPLQVFENCTCMDGFSFNDDGVDISGTFINCVGGENSFGATGVASGRFINCVGGDGSFGGSGTASGIFTNCTGGSDSFGGNGTASGTFTNCKGGENSFAGGNGTASGIFTNCTGGVFSFGSEGGTLSGKFTSCQLTAGTFSSLTAPVTGKAQMINCIDGNGDIINGEASA